MFLIRKIGVPDFCYTDFYTDFEKSPLFLAVFALDWLAVRDGFEIVGFPMGCGCDVRKSHFTLDWFALARFAAWFAPKWPVF